MATFKTTNWDTAGICTKDYDNLFRGKQNKNRTPKQVDSKEKSKYGLKKEMLKKKKEKFVAKNIKTTKNKIIPKKGAKVTTVGISQNTVSNLGQVNFKSRKEIMKLSLRERMLERLKSSRFRYINEELYTSEGKSANKLFKRDRNAFEVYHEGYRQQVSKWPMNPLDVIIKSIQKMNTDKVIADMGCGEAKLAQSVRQKVHSYDLQAANEYVTEREMSNVPLEKNSVDVAVFCLSLMGTNIKDFICEANRILKIGGILKIAEVQSRFEKVDAFIRDIERFGFKQTWKDLSKDLFYFMDFKKTSDCKPKNKLPAITLLPCLYKKR